MLLWALPPGNCHWGTIGEESQSRVGGVVLIRWRVRLEADSGLLLEALQLIQPWVRQVSLRTPGTDWGLHPAGLQRPHQDRPLARPRAWGSGEPFPYPCLWDLLAVASCLGHSLWDLVSPSGLPEETEDQLGRMPGSQGWQLGRMWEPGLKELPTEICLLLARTGTLEGKGCALGLCFFLSGQRIHLIEIYRNIATWPWTDL